MNYKMSGPKAVNMAVYRTTNDALDGDVHDAVPWATHEFLFEAVDTIVWRAVSDAVDGSVTADSRTRPPHPNLQRFISEIRQAQEGAA